MNDEFLDYVVNAGNVMGLIPSREYQEDCEEFYRRQYERNVSNCRSREYRGKGVGERTRLGSRLEREVVEHPIYYGDRGAMHSVPEPIYDSSHPEYNPFNNVFHPNYNPFKNVNLKISPLQNQLIKWKRLDPINYNDALFILSLTNNASKKVVSKNYHMLLLKYHPDKCRATTREERMLCDELTQIISQARNTVFSQKGYSFGQKSKKKRKSKRRRRSKKRKSRK